MKVSIDRQRYSQKPDKGTAGAISKRVAEQVENLEVQEIAEQLVQPYGRTFSPAVFADGQRKNANWKEQQLFGLDFDEGITVEQVLGRCKEYNIKPVFIYSTFSSNESNNKFRVFFCHETVLIDYRIRTVIQYALHMMFKEADGQCKDGSRFFYGGKELLYTDYGSTFNAVDLVKELCRYINDTDRVNAAREIKRYCECVGLDMLNGMPKILPLGGTIETSIDSEEDNESTKSEETMWSSIYTMVLIVAPTKSSKNEYSFYFAKSNNTHKVRTEGNPKKFKVINERIEREKLIEDFSFDDLKESCELWKGFSEGQHWAYHNELTGIAMNLIAVKGGRKKFIEALEKAPFDYEVNKWEYYCNYFAKTDYAPMQCDNFCPYTDTCGHTRNMIDQVKLMRGQVRVLSTPEAKTLDQAERELTEAFSTALEAKDTNVYVIKAATGIGKSKLYETVKNVTIALPTHKLKEEIAERMTAAGNTFKMSPKLPEDEHTDNISYLYSVGSYMLANQLIRKLAKENPEYAEYVKLSKAMDNASGTVLTTHEKLLSLCERIGNDTIIIDEDIISSMMPIATTRLKDLETLTKECGYIDTCTTLKSIYEYIDGSLDGLVSDMPSYGEIKTSRLESIVSENRINTNVLGLLTCSHFIKYTHNDEVVISFVNQRYLPETKKIIMLSATANEYICKLVFGDRLRFIDIGYVENKGKIEQYTQRSFSRSSMREDEKLKKLAKALTKSNPTITFKEHAGCFDNCVATFGATAGINAFSGQDIAVVGTPHLNPIVYLLFANALGKKPRGCNTAKNSTSYIKIKRNGFEFYFQTYNKEDILQEIQLYLIEAELLQAIGRARALRNECTVTVLSNLPVQGAEFKYLTKEELEEILKDDVG